MSSENIDWKAEAIALAKMVQDLIEIVQAGPCCGSGDEMTSHYHCPKCGKVGGMYIALDDHPGCKQDLEYQRKQQLPSLVEKACDDILSKVAP